MPTSSYIQLSLHKNIDSLYLSNKNIEGIDVTLFALQDGLSLPGNRRGAKSQRIITRLPATANPVPLTDPTRCRELIAYIT